MNNIATHSFSVELATKYGVMEAIMLGHIAYWVNFNRNAKKNFYDEKYWMYQSMAEMACHFPYLSEDQIFRVISKLVKKGLLIKGNFNKIKFDKTSWYTIGNEILENSSSAIPRNRGTDDAKSRNRSCEIADPIPDTKERCLKEDNIDASAPSAEDVSPSGELRGCSRDRTDTDSKDDSDLPETLVYATVPSDDKVFDVSCIEIKKLTNILMKRYSLKAIQAAINAYLAQMTPVKNIVAYIEGIIKKGSKETASEGIWYRNHKGFRKRPPGVVTGAESGCFPEHECNRIFSKAGFAAV